MGMVYSFTSPLKLFYLWLGPHLREGCEPAAVIEFTYNTSLGNQGWEGGGGELKGAGLRVGKGSNGHFQCFMHTKQAEINLFNLCYMQGSNGKQCSFLEREKFSLWDGTLLILSRCVSDTWLYHPTAEWMANSWPRRTTHGNRVKLWLLRSCMCIFIGLELFTDKSVRSQSTETWKEIPFLTFLSKWANRNTTDYIHLCDWVNHVDRKFVLCTILHTFRSSFKPNERLNIKIN